MWHQWFNCNFMKIWEYLLCVKKSWLDSTIPLFCDVLCCAFMTVPRHIIFFLWTIPLGLYTLKVYTCQWSSVTKANSLYVQTYLQWRWFWFWSNLKWTGIKTVSIGELQVSIPTVYTRYFEECWRPNSWRFSLYGKNTLEVNGYHQLFGYQHSSKYLLSFSTKERNSYWFGTTWWWVNDGIFGWSIPF